ncbi:MAG: hypothetical protein AB4063_12460 [Crocosphaera sp.]
MTEALQFRVFLDEDKVKDIDLSLFPDGVPCSDFLALDYLETVPNKFVFFVDKDKLDLTQNYQLYQEYGEVEITTFEKGEVKSLFIPVEAVKELIDSYENTPSLKLMKQAWILSNHVSRLDDLEIKLNGEVSHVVLMGLQQALFIDPSSGPSLNPMLFELSIHLIKQLSQGNEILEEYFITGFPCEYINQAKALLFPE